MVTSVRRHYPPTDGWRHEVPRVAVRASARLLRKPRTTFAMFKKADEDNDHSIGGSVSYHYGFLVETIVWILLLLTILYCVRLNKQLRLKSDEQSLRGTRLSGIGHRHRKSPSEQSVGLKIDEISKASGFERKLERADGLSTELDLRLTTPANLACWRG